ncbi:MAG: hypothetical protein WBA43_25300, partial [Elainellaceae cyanobacterium]
MAWTPRRVGDRITYSSTATRQYKSAWRRWNQGRSIRGSLAFRGGSLATVRFPSTRSPVGYWETAVLLGSDGGTGQPSQSCPLPLSGYRSIQVVNYLDVGESYRYEERVPNNGPEDVYDERAPISVSVASGFTYPLNPGEYVELRLSFPARTDDPFQDGSFLDGVVISYLSTSTARYSMGIFRADGSLRDVIRVTSGRIVYPGVYTRRVRQADHVGNYIVDEGTDRTVTFDLRVRNQDGSYTILPGVGSACGVPAPGAGRPSCENSVGACTCPDYQKKQGVVMASAFASERRFRDWSDSAAGVASGEPPNWCKHIWSTVIQYCAGGNAARLEPPRDGAYPRPSRGSDSPYGAPSTDDLDWESWQADR